MKKFFSKPFFERWTKEASPETQKWFKRENEILKKIVKKGSDVLDIGCGFGRHMRILAKFCKEVVGVDYSKTMVEKAKENLAKFSNIEVYLENAQEMHFEDESFDYVICMSNTFGIFLNKELEILREMKRVLKQDGKIIISVYSENALDIRIKDYKKVGLHIEKIKGGKVYFREGHATRQFSKKQMVKLFDSVELKAEVTELTPISYLCIATKS